MMKNSFYKVVAVSCLSLGVNLASAANIPAVYSTGLDASGNLVDITPPYTTEVAELNWALLSTPITTTSQPVLKVLNPNPNWAAPTNSRWIGPENGGSQNYPDGDYVYQLDFDIPDNLDPTTAKIVGEVLSDNETEVYFNGQLIPLSTAGAVAPPAEGVFNAPEAFTIEHRIDNVTFMQTGNTLTVRVKNTPPNTSPTGVAVAIISAIADPKPVITITPPNNGNVTSTGGIDCGTGGNSCEEAVISGDSITLTAIPDAHYVFVEWTGDCFGTENPMTITIIGNPVCGASFVLDQHDLAIDPAPMNGTVTTNTGAIDCGSQSTVCTDAYVHGTPVTLTATPDLGYQFDGWSGDADCLDGQVTMNLNVACTANFSLIPVDASVPTLSQYGLMLMTVLLGLLGGGLLRRRRS